ncbi:DUF1212-domain-containing protein [Aspergillus heteromorphus CBS 117.55]|uniref:DUF1212-domain-containing protein n=1 Tax=Aspergillus heteromorphus CBS 117.55 TaxID=1448321 RepID=A0A317WT38_9EURO|nr:DUF1212-domain-containing protein [Aspergillus heteromorphus CBS 117.55]PWY87400.1 DUF1212-domain-containing protein [Aspergillus heteromorphus CBS 117.55]
MSSPTDDNHLLRPGSGPGTDHESTHADDHLVNRSTNNTNNDERPLTRDQPPPSGPNQWGVLFKAIREGTSQLAEKLGRDPDGGDGLDSAWHPEDYGYQEDIEMRDMMAQDEIADKEYAAKLQSVLGSDAKDLVTKLGLGETPSRTNTQEENLMGGVLWHLLGHQMGHNREASLEDGAVPISAEDGLAPLPSELRKRRKKKWYDEDPSNDKAGKRKVREALLTQKIGSLLTRQRYMLQLCRALMKFGAPTHRLEEYLQMSANVLRVQGQFMYIPSCMIMSFDDPLTRTAEVKLIRTVQGLDLGRLGDIHNCYKNVLHGKLSAEEALPVIDDILTRKNKFSNPWVLVGLSGLASVAVGPWAFEARPVDMPIIFLLGCMLGFMQYVLAPRSALYSNVFEVTVAMATSFLARAFGSIYRNGEPVFCFSALAESAIALILPGYSVLCSSLELQSHQIVAGSIRLVYTIIYSLFLGYGVTVGITIYGLIDDNATNASTCSARSHNIYGSVYVQEFVFVAVYCAFAAILNQAKWKQLPIMSFMGVAGYVTNYLATSHLSSWLGSTIGAFTIGLCANLYSRVWHGHAAAAIVPGMWTLVSSGLASSGSIISGLSYANAVKNNTVTTETSTATEASLGSLGLTMVQTALGITVGLFLSALVVYPGGKRKGGIFNL